MQNRSGRCVCHRSYWIAFIYLNVQDLNPTSNQLAFSLSLGNHDLTLDDNFVRENLRSFSNQQKAPEECYRLLSGAPSLTFMCHESRTIKLLSPSGPRTTFKLFASPFSPKFGKWAFMYDYEDGPRIWDAVPLDTDVLVTHCPPWGLHDRVATTRENVGCKGLLQALWRVRPILSVFGHIHEGRGASRVKWNLEPSVQPSQHNERDDEARSLIKSKTTWEDPAPSGGKNCLVDLSSRSVQGRLDNDGSIKLTQLNALPPTAGTCNVTSMVNQGITYNTSEKSIDLNSPLNQFILSGSLGRKETCVVNAAIQKHSFVKKTNQNHLHKPIVVDIDLPVWD